MLVFFNAGLRHHGVNQDSPPHLTGTCQSRTPVCSSLLRAPCPIVWAPCLTFQRCLTDRLPGFELARSRPAPFVSAPVIDPVSACSLSDLWLPGSTSGYTFPQWGFLILELAVVWVSFGWNSLQPWSCEQFTDLINKDTDWNTMRVLLLSPVSEPCLSLSFTILSLTNTDE